MRSQDHALVHEIWLDPEPDGQMLTGLCIAGPMGDDFRGKLNRGAIKTGTIEGFSHFDVMTKYWKVNGWGAYRAKSSDDHELYPLGWITIQREFFRREN